MRGNVAALSLSDDDQTKRITLGTSDPSNINTEHTPDLTRLYREQLPDDACRDTAKPPTFEPCNVLDCPKWITREWSGVSVLFCCCVFSLLLQKIFLDYIRLTL